MKIDETIKDILKPKYFLKIVIEPSKKYPGRFNLYLAGPRGYVHFTVARKQLHMIAEIFNRAFTEAKLMPAAPNLQKLHTVPYRKRNGTMGEAKYREDGYGVGSGTGLPEVDD